MAHAEGRPQLRAIEELAMTMRQQAPQPAEGRRGDGNAELGDIPFQKGADEALAPLITGRLAPGEQTAGEAAAYPQRDEGHRRGRCDFGGEQGRQFQEHNTPGQRLRRLAQERIRGRAQEEEPRRRNGPGRPVASITRRKTGKRSGTRCISSRQKSVAGRWLRCIRKKSSGSAKRRRSEGRSRSSRTVWGHCPTVARTSVVLPHCRGPTRATAGKSCNACSRRLCIWRGI